MLSYSSPTQLQRADEATPARVRAILSRRPSIGLAIGVVRDGLLEFHGHGFADIASETPVTEDTVFRVGSITKTLTAVAVMQLWERGLIDLDAAANELLSGYQLTPENPRWRPATVRHLLTHTAGIPDVLHPGDLFHPGWGSLDSRPPIHSVRVGETLPSLAEYYRGTIRLVTEPGSAFAYSNHGFATLGQIVEEVSGETLDHYFRRHIFEPLGMTRTDLCRTETIESSLAKGYGLGRHGAEEVPDREWVGSGGGGVYSSSRDMARYVAALVGHGSNETGSMLQAATVATMFEPHYLTDPRLVGMGLGFFLHHADGHRVVGHDGILPGFNSSLLIVPDKGLGVFGFTNGSRGAMVWLPTEVEGLLRELLAIPTPTLHGDIPHHPEIWGELCGRYRLPPVGDLRGRLLMGGGAQVFVSGGRLMVRILTPLPALYRGLPLHPDDDTDPYVFRLDLSRFGMPQVRLIFGREGATGSRVIHTDLGGQPISLYERSADGARPRPEPSREMPA